MTIDSQIAAVIVAVCPSEAQAKEALKQLETMNRQGTIDLIEAATVTKDAEGKVHVVDTADVGTKKWSKRDAAIGGVIGGVLGLIFPPSIVAGAIGGGALGALYGHFREKGGTTRELAQSGADLEPGQSAVIAVLVDRFVAQVEQGLRGYATLTTTRLDADASAAVLAARKRG